MSNPTLYSDFTLVPSSLSINFNKVINNFRVNFQVERKKNCRYSKYLIYHNFKLFNIWIKQIAIVLWELFSTSCRCIHENLGRPHCRRNFSYLPDAFIHFLVIMGMLNIKLLRSIRTKVFALNLSIKCCF